MDKRGYKLQDFVAHSANISCLNIGKKECKLFVTGGEDRKVNVWAIGKPTSLMSLCGHTSPIESVAFDSSEVLVLAGAFSGVIKLWDLEETKMVCTLTGHRSICTAVEFHPFGEFFASGSMDTNLKIWDIRKKGCTHTYKGHTQGISTIKFTPDGRWVISGGFDNVVKVWDLTAGKPLHDFNFHEGRICSLDFHPLEFLLATSSADRTVKFWDLETFELIGSTRYEATGICVINFHPDGRTLFSGLDNSLKVYSWEPVICHDTIDMGWSVLGDMCIHEEKLLACSYYQNSVAVWVSDISLIEPYGGGSTVQNDVKVQNYNHKLQRGSDKVGNDVRTSSLNCELSDEETKEIKNIYIDTGGIKPGAPQKVEPLRSPKGVPPLNAKDITDLPKKQNPTVGTSLRYTPSPPSNISDQLMKRQSPTTGVTKCNETVANKSFDVPIIVPQDTSNGKDSVNSRQESITFTKTRRGMLLKPAHIRRISYSTNDDERLQTAVESETSGNTRDNLDCALGPNFQTKTVLENSPGVPCGENHFMSKSIEEKSGKVPSSQIPPKQETCNNSLDCRREINPVKFVNGVAVIPGRTRTLVDRFERKEISKSQEDQTTNSSTAMIPARDISPSTPVNFRSSELAQSHEDEATNLSTFVIPATDKTPSPSVNFERREISKRNEDKAANLSTPVILEMDERASTSIDFERKISKRNEEKTANIPITVIPEMDERFSTLKEEPQISARDSTSVNDRDATENLMQTHDVFLSSLRSRLTKIQVVRHFWERNDIKGAINATRKFPDHSVQADVISVLMEKRDILNLDLFSCLLPGLVGLLDSKIERHITLSLEFLVKFVAVFGPVIRSTMSAPRSVGVNLHAEQRIKCCKQCSLQLQKIQKVLPALVRKGGAVTKGALELSLLLQES